MNFLVSVLIPVFNAEKYIEQALSSILSQSYHHLEILILDDASTDKTSKVIDTIEDSRISLYSNPENLGYLKSCNRLFELASGDFITFQDADDFSRRDRISKQVDAFNKNPKLGLCGTSISRINSNGEILFEEIKNEHHEEIFREMYSSPQFCGATIMVPKKVLKHIGGYRPYFDRLGSEDYDWSLRIAEKYETCNLPESLYFYRQHSGAISKEINPKKMISSEVAQFLAKERRGLKADAIEAENSEKLRRYEEQLLEPFKEDSTLIYRKFASWFNYNKMYSAAVRASWMAVIKKTNSKNLRTLFYCLRQLLLK